MLIKEIIDRKFKISQNSEQYLYVKKILDSYFNVKQVIDAED